MNSRLQIIVRGAGRLRHRDLCGVAPANEVARRWWRRRRAVFALLGLVTANAAGAGERYVWRGLLTSGGRALFAIEDRERTRTVWLPLGGEVGGAKIVQHEPAAEVLILQADGRAIHLSLPAARTRHAEMPPPEVPVRPDIGEGGDWREQAERAASDGR